MIPAAVAAVFFLVLLLPSLSPHYGFYSDELYNLACADRPALGYVDQPPLFVWWLRLHRDIFGDSLVALRALPAATGAATAYLAGHMARRLGGGGYAEFLATLGVSVSITALAIFSIFTVNCTGILLWTVASWLLVELCRSREPRLWLGLGAVLGLALLTKHTAVVPVAGVAVATLLTPLRSDLRGPWPWLGAAIALALVAPNVYWQLANDWPSLAFYARAEEGRHSLSAVGQLLLQFGTNNPAAFPVWVAGGYFFLRADGGARYRPLGWFFLTGLVLAIIGGSALPYRIAGIFPVALAGGAVLLESRRRPDAGPLRRLWNTWTLPTAMLAIGLLAASLILPILPPSELAKHPLYEADEGSGWRPEIGRNEIPYHLGNRTHWTAFVDQVTQVVRDLDPAERRGSIILADYFGHAGALEHYGRDLPPVYSPMTGYFLWGPPSEDASPVIAIGIDREFLRENFGRVEEAAVFRCEYCPPVVNSLPIYVASERLRSFEELWPEIGALDDRRTRLTRAQATSAAE